MRQRPLLLFALSMGYFAVAISLPVQIMAIYGHGLDEMDMVLAKLTILNWLVISGSIVCGVLVWGASPILRIAVPLLTAMVAINNLIVGYYAVDFSLLSAMLATVAFSGFNLPLLHGPLRDLMLNPERRWWRHATRYQRKVPVIISGEHRMRVRGTTFDLSESGVFIEVGDGDLQVHETISIRMTFGSFAQVRCEGRVVRQAAAVGEYPSGYGIQFVNMDPRQLQELRRQLAH